MRETSVMKRAIAGGLASVLLCTSVTDSLAQANFWSERHAAQNPAAGENKTRSPLSGFQWPKEEAHPIFGAYRLPATQGAVIETHAAAAGAKTLLHIQDAHNLYPAQQNAADIMGGLLKAGWAGPLTVYQEGGVGWANVEWLSAFPFSDIKERVARARLQENQLTGEEYRAVVESSGAVRLMGVETQELYRQNLAMRHETAAARAEAEKRITALQARLQRIKDRRYPGPLKELDRTLRAYAERELSFIPYVQALAASKPVSSETYPNLSSLLKLDALESALDFRALAVEREALVAKLAENLSKESLESITRQALSLRQGKITPLDFYTGLLDSAETLRRRRVNIAVAELRKYVGYLRVTETLRHDSLMTEAEQLKGRLLEGYAADDALWRLVNLDRRVALEKLLWRQEMTPDQYAAFKEMGALDWPEVERYIAAQEAALRLLTPAAADFAWAKALPQVRAFYELALERDIALVKNALADMEKTGASRGVLVAGGFHTPGITRLLRQSGVAYAVLQPRFESNGKVSLRINQALDRLAQSAREVNPLSAGNLGRSAGENPGLQFAAIAYAVARVDALSMPEGARQAFLRKLNDWRQNQADDAGLTIYAAYQVGRTADDALTVVYLRAKGENLAFAYRPAHAGRSGEVALWIGEKDLQGANRAKIAGLADNVSVLDWISRNLALLREGVSAAVFQREAAAGLAGLANTTGQILWTPLDSAESPALLPQAASGRRDVQNAFSALGRAVVGAWARLSFAAQVLRVQIRRIATFGVFLAVMLPFTPLASAQAAIIEQGADTTRVTIEAGDTMWKAARQYLQAQGVNNPTDTRIAQTVELLGKSPGASANINRIQPNQVISVANAGAAPQAIAPAAGPAAAEGMVLKTAPSLVARAAAPAPAIAPDSAALKPATVLSQLSPIAPAAAQPAPPQAPAAVLPAPATQGPTDLNAYVPGVGHAEPAFGQKAFVILKDAFSAAVIALVAWFGVGGAARRRLLTPRRQREQAMEAKQAGQDYQSTIGKSAVAFLAQGRRTFPEWLAGPVTRVLERRRQNAKTPNDMQKIPKAPPIYSTHGAHGIMAAYSALSAIKEQLVVWEKKNPELVSLRAQLAAATKEQKAITETYDASRLPRVAELRGQIAGLESQINDQVIAQQRRLLAPVLEDLANQTEFILNQAPEAERGAWQKMVAITERRLRHYENAPIPAGFTLSRKARAMDILQKAGQIIFVTVFLGLAFQFPFAVALVAWAVGFPILYYTANPFIEKILGLVFMWIVDGQGHRKVDFLDFVAEHKARTGHAHAVDILVPKFSNNGMHDAFVKKTEEVLKPLVRGLDIQGEFKPGDFIASSFDFAKGVFTVNTKGLPRGPRRGEAVGRLMEAYREEIKRALGAEGYDVEDLRLPVAFSSEITGDVASAAWRQRVAEILSGPETPLALEDVTIEKGVFEIRGLNLTALSPEAIAPVLSEAFGLDVVVSVRDGVVVVRPVEAGLRVTLRPSPWLERIAAAFSNAGLNVSAEMVRQEGEVYEIDPAAGLAQADALSLPAVAEALSQDLGIRVTVALDADGRAVVRAAEEEKGLDLALMDVRNRLFLAVGQDADTWFVYRRLELQSLRDTFRAAGDNFQVNYVMASNTGRDDMIYFENMRIRELSREVERDPLLRGRINFIYLHQKIPWVNQDGKNQGAGWAKKVGNVFAYTRLTQSTHSGDVYASRLFEHSLVPQSPLFPNARNNGGDLFKYYGRDVVIEGKNGDVTRLRQANGAVEVTVNGRQLQALSASEADGAIAKALADPDVERIRPHNAGAAAEFVIILDDKNQVFDGSVEKAVSMMAHPGSRGFALGNPAIEVTQPMKPRLGRPGEVMTSSLMQSMSRARMIHNQFSSRLKAAIFGNASGMYGKAIVRRDLYAQMYSDEVLQPSRILSHDWQESVYMFTEALFGARRFKITALEETPPQVQENLRRWQAIVRVERGAERELYRLSFTDDGRATRLAVERVSKAGGWEYQRDFEFAAGAPQKAMLDHFAKFVNNDMVVGERDLLTFPEMIGRDLRWLRGDWQMLFTMIVYARDALFPAARAHLGGIEKRFLLDTAFLAQIILFSVFFILPFFVYVVNATLAKWMFGIVMVSIAGIDSVLAPFLYAQKQTFRIATSENRWARLALGVFWPVVFMGYTVLGFVQWAAAVSISLMSVLLRVPKVWQLFADEMLGRETKWNASTASAVREMQGFTLRESMTPLIMTMRVAFLVAVPFFILMLTGQVFTSWMGYSALGILLISWAWGPIGSHFSGIPFPLFSGWRQRVKRGTVTGLMALVLFPVFMGQLNESVTENRIESYRMDGVIEGVIQRVGDPAFRAPEISGPIVPRQAIPGLSYQSPASVTPPMPAVVSKLSIPRIQVRPSSAQVLAPEQKALASGERQLPIFEPFSPQRVFTDPIDPLEYTVAPSPNKAKLGDFLPKVSKLGDDERKKKSAGLFVGKSLAARAPVAAQVLAIIDWFQYASANVETKYPWLREPAIALYWKETALLTNYTMNEMADFLAWDKTAELHKLDYSKFAQNRELRDRDGKLVFGPDYYRKLIQDNFGSSSHRYDAVNTAVLALHYGLGIPLEKITQAQVVDFTIKLNELQDLWKDGRYGAPSWPIEPKTFLSKGAKDGLRGLGNVSFVLSFFGLGVPGLSQLPLGAIPLAESFLTGQGGTSAALAQSLFLNNMTTPDFMEHVGARYIERFHDAAANPPNADLLRLVRDRLEHGWKALGLDRKLDDKEVRFVYLQTEYSLGRTAVFNTTGNRRPPLADIRKAALEVSRHMAQIGQLMAKYPTLNGIARYQSGAIETEAIQAYLTAQRGGSVKDLLLDVDASFAATERLLKDMTAGKWSIDPRYEDLVHSRMPAEARGGVTPEAKQLNAVRALASAMQNAEANGLKDSDGKPLAARQLMADYLSMDAWMRQYANIPVDKPGVVDYMVFYQRGINMTTTEFRAHFGPRLQIVNELTPLRAQLQASPAWKAEEARVNQEIEKRGRAVKDPALRFYNALSSAANLVLATENAFPNVAAQTRANPSVRAALALKQTERLAQYRAQAARYPSLPWTERGYTESFVVQGYPIDSLQKEAEIFGLGTVNALWNDGSYERIRKNSPVFAQLIEARVAEDYRAAGITNRTPTPTELKHGILQSFGQLAVSGLENLHPERTNFSHDEIRQAGLAVIGHLAAVAERAQETPFIWNNYMVKEPGILENEAIFILLLAQKSPDKVAPYIESLAPIFRTTEALLKAELRVIPAYAKLVFSRTEPDALARMSESGKRFMVVRSVASVLQNARDNNSYTGGAVAAGQRLMADITDTIAHFQMTDKAGRAAFENLPLGEPGIAEYFTLLRAKAGKSAKEFWAHMDPRLRQVNGWMVDAKFIGELNQSDHWKWYVAEVNNELSAKTGVQEANPRLRSFNAFMALVEMVFDTEQKHPDVKGRVEPAELVRGLNHLKTGARAQYSALPNVPGYWESLATSAYRVGPEQAVRLNFLAEINELLQGKVLGNAALSADIARLQQIIRREAVPGSQIAPEVMNSLILQKILNVSKTFMIPILPSEKDGAAGFAFIVRGLAEMDRQFIDREGEIPNLVAAFKDDKGVMERGAADRWLGVAYHQRLSVAEVIESYVKPIDRNLEAARKSVLGFELGLGTREQGLINDRLVSEIENDLRAPPGSLMRPTVSPAQLLVDRLFYDVHRLRVLNDQLRQSGKTEVSLEVFLNEYYRLVSVMKSRFMSDMVQVQTNPQALGRIVGRLENYAYTFSLFTHHVFAGEQDTPERRAFAAQGIKNTDDLINRFFQNAEALRGIPEFAQAVDELRAVNPFEAAAAEFSYALTMSVNPKIDAAMVKKLAAHLPSVLRNYQDFFGASLRITSPAVFYDMMYGVEELLNLDALGQGDERRAVKVKTVVSDWAVRTIVKESYQAIFNIYLDQTRHPEHKEILDEWVRRYQKGVVKNLDEIVSMIARDGGTRAQPNTFAVEQSRLQSGVEETRRYLKSLQDQRLGALLQQVEDQLAVRLQTLDNHNERLRHLHRLAQGFESALEKSKSNTVRTVAELLAIFLGLFGAVGFVRAAQESPRRAAPEVKSEAQATSGGTPAAPLEPAAPVLKVPANGAPSAWLRLARWASLVAVSMATMAYLYVGSNGGLTIASSLSQIYNPGPVQKQAAPAVKAVEKLPVVLLEQGPFKVVTAQDTGLESRVMKINGVDATEIQFFINNIRIGNGTGKGYFRFRSSNHDDGPSLVNFSLWSKGSYLNNAPFSEATVKMEGDAIVFRGRMQDHNGNFGGTLVMRISGTADKVTVDVDGEVKALQELVAIDRDRVENTAEGFKAVDFRSHHSEKTHDSDTLSWGQWLLRFAPETTGRIFFPKGQLLAAGQSFELANNSPVSGRFTSTYQVTLKTPMRLNGYIIPSQDPNADNVAVWAQPQDMSALNFQGKTYKWGYTIRILNPGAYDESGKLKKSKAYIETGPEVTRPVRFSPDYRPAAPVRTQLQLGSAENADTLALAGLFWPFGITSAAGAAAMRRRARQLAERGRQSVWAGLLLMLPGAGAEDASAAPGIEIMSRQEFMAQQSVRDRPVFAGSAWRVTGSLDRGPAPVAIPTPQGPVTALYARNEKGQHVTLMGDGSLGLMSAGLARFRTPMYWTGGKLFGSAFTDVQFETNQDGDLVVRAKMRPQDPGQGVLVDNFAVRFVSTRIGLVGTVSYTLVAGPNGVTLDAERNKQGQALKLIETQFRNFGWANQKPMQDLDVAVVVNPAGVLDAWQLSETNKLYGPRPLLRGEEFHLANGVPVRTNPSAQGGFIKVNRVVDGEGKPLTPLAGAFVSGVSMTNPNENLNNGAAWVAVRPAKTTFAPGERILSAEIAVAGDQGAYKIPDRALLTGERPSTPPTERRTDANPPAATDRRLEAKRNFRVASAAAAGVGYGLIAGAAAYLLPTDWTNAALNIKTLATATVAAAGLSGFTYYLYRLTLVARGWLSANRGVKAADLEGQSAWLYSEAQRRGLRSITPSDDLPAGRLAQVDAEGHVTIRPWIVQSPALFDHVLTHERRRLRFQKAWFPSLVVYAISPFHRMGQPPLAPEALPKLAALLETTLTPAPAPVSYDIGPLPAPGVTFQYYYNSVVKRLRELENKRTRAAIQSTPSPVVSWGRGEFGASDNPILPNHRYFRPLSRMSSAGQVLDVLAELPDQVVYLNSGDAAGDTTGASNWANLVPMDEIARRVLPRGRFPIESARTYNQQIFTGGVVAELVAWPASAVHFSVASDAGAISPYLYGAVEGFLAEIKEAPGYSLLAFQRDNKAHVYVFPRSKAWSAGTSGMFGALEGAGLLILAESPPQDKNLAALGEEFHRKLALGSWGGEEQISGSLRGVETGPRVASPGAVGVLAAAFADPRLGLTAAFAWAVLDRQAADFWRLAWGRVAALWGGAMGVSQRLMNGLSFVTSQVGQALAGLPFLLAVPLQAGLLEKPGTLGWAESVRGQVGRLGLPRLPGLPEQAGHALVADLRDAEIVGLNVRVDQAVALALRAQLTRLSERLGDDAAPVALELVFSDAVAQEMRADPQAVAGLLAQARISPAVVEARVLGQSEVGRRLNDLQGEGRHIVVVAPAGALGFWKAFGLSLAILTAQLTALMRVETDVVFTGAAAEALKGFANGTTVVRDEDGSVTFKKGLSPIDAVERDAQKISLLQKQA